MDNVLYTTDMNAPEGIIKKRAQKVVDAGMNIPLAQLTESIHTNEKLDEIISKPNEVTVSNFPEYPEFPEYPSEMVISNLPDVQKVELVNPPKEKDDSEVKNLLKELVAEAKKKEQLAYDIEIDPTLKEQLKGERGLDGKNGLDGNVISPSEVVSKLESLEGEDRLDVSAIRGTKSLIEDIATKIAKEEVKKVKKQYVSVGGALSTGGAEGVNEDSFGIVVDGAGTAITTGSKGTRYIPYNCTITGWSIQGTPSGSCIFDVKRSGTSLAGSEKPTLSGASSNQDLALSTWTTSLSAGDVVEFVVDSASTVTRATVTILVSKI